MIPEKLSPIERALAAASLMSSHQARQVVKFICEAGMTTATEVRQPTQGEIHYSKREKFIKRMKSSCDRVINYAKHETLHNIEKHFNETGMSAAEEQTEEEKKKALAERLAFEKKVLAVTFLAALQEEQQAAIQTAGQQLFDEVGFEKAWKPPLSDVQVFLRQRANLLANVPDEVHAEIMQSIEQGLQHGESRKELMARISAAFDEIGRSRAETIANTETAAAFNYARDKAMREAGVTHKKWLHSQSPLIQEPRPTHLEADGQIQPIDEPFDVGGVQFMRPADDSLGAGPEDIINCHCVAIPVEAPIESAGEKEGHPFRGNQWTKGEAGSETWRALHELVGSDGDQRTMRTTIKQGSKNIGYVDWDYDKWEKIPRILMIEVNPKFQGHGVANSVIKDIMREIGSDKIQGTYSTPAGEMLRKNLERQGIKFHNPDA